MRDGMARIKPEDTLEDAPTLTLGRAKAAAVKQQKEAAKGEARKVVERPLSPRSMQLKEAAEQEVTECRHIPSRHPPSRRRHVSSRRPSHAMVRLVCAHGAGADSTRGGGCSGGAG